MSIEIKKDGRTIRDGKDYTNFRRGMWEKQVGRCSNCRRYTDLRVEPLVDWSFNVHHIEGRGLGGSKRDDVVERNGIPVCTGVCGLCHKKEHNQA